MTSISPVSLPPDAALNVSSPQFAAPSAEGAGPSELRTAFDSFVGEVFYGQMLKAMRETTGKPAYFHGGRGEEVFREQLDQTLAQEMTEAGAHTFTGPMFELFSQNRR
jgi:Rod binding domain-containing protein